MTIDEFNSIPFGANTFVLYNEQVKYVISVSFTESLFALVDDKENVPVEEWEWVRCESVTLLEKDEKPVSKIEVTPLDFAINKSMDTLGQDKTLELLARAMIFTAHHAEQDMVFVCNGGTIEIKRYSFEKATSENKDGKQWQH